MNDFYAVVVVMLFVLGIAVAAEWYVCKSQSTMMSKVYDYGPVQGCMIRHKGEWIPLDKYRVLD